MSIKSVAIDNGGAAADIQVVAAPDAGRVIRVLNYVLVAGGTVTVKWASGTAAGVKTDLTGAMPLTSGQGLWPGWIGDDFNGRACHFETDPGKGLVLVFGGGVQVSGYVNYWVAPAS